MSVSAIATVFLRLSLALSVLAAPAVTLAQATSTVQAQASGEVRRIDAQNNKVAVKQGPIPELELGEMTLVYRTTPELLSKIKPGDRIRFTAARKDDQYWIIDIER